MAPPKFKPGDFVKVTKRSSDLLRYRLNEPVKIRNTYSDWWGTRRIYEVPLFDTLRGHYETRSFYSYELEPAVDMAIGIEELI